MFCNLTGVVRVNFTQTVCSLFGARYKKHKQKFKKKSGWRAGEQRKLHWITFYKLAITDRLIYDFTIDTNTDI